MSDEKKPVKLIVSDIDNTISDYFNNWGLAWDKGVEELAKSRGLEKDKLYDSIRENSDGYARFHNFPDIIAQTPELSYEGKSAEERKRLEKADAKICHDVAKQYMPATKCMKASSPPFAKPKPPARSSSCTPIRPLPARSPVWLT